MLVTTTERHEFTAIFFVFSKVCIDFDDF